MKKIILAISGASGVIYGISLLKALLEHNSFVYLIISDSAFLIMQHEMESEQKDIISFLKKENIKNQKNLHILKNNDFFTPIASGSFQTDGMAIVPSSMKTVGEIANGIGSSLISRSADVTLKEKRKLIIAPRETPFNQIHLENMLRLSKAGATLMPCLPCFYLKPKTIDEIIMGSISRILDHLGIDNQVAKRWTS